MRARREDTDEAQWRRGELHLLQRAQRRRLRDIALGGLLIVAIVAVIFWLIGLSPPPRREPESRFESQPAGQAPQCGAVLAATTRFFV